MLRHIIILIMLLSHMAMAEPLIESDQDFALTSDSLLVVGAPYLELKSGPGRAYDVIKVLKQGEQIRVIRRKTSWLLLEDSKGTRGWLARNQLSGNVLHNDNEVFIEMVGSTDYFKKDWSFALAYGQLSGRSNDGSPMLTVSGSYFFASTMSLELVASQVISQFSESQLFHMNLNHDFFPESRFSPFLTMGVGVVETTAKATLGDTETSKDDAVNAGLGINYYVADNFFIRLDLNQHMLLTDNNDLNKVKTWKLGIGTFF